MEIRNKSSFSYCFDPKFSHRYVAFWTEFRENPEQGVKQLRDDVVLFIEMCCKTVSRDPVTELLSIKQMELMPAQKELAKALQLDIFLKQKAAVLLKSRQQGASWIMCAFALWLAIFYPGQVILFTTKSKEDLHILGDPMTLMGKVEYMFESLSELFSEHAITKSKFIKRNFVINKTILKGAFGKQAGRSQTATLTINDEFDYILNQKAMLSSMKNACNANIFLSTLYSPGSEFDRMRGSDAYIQLRLSYHDDLRIKDKEQFKKDYIAKNGKADFDREMEMLYSQEDAMYVFDHDWLGPLEENAFKAPPDIYYPTVAGLDVAGEGNNLNVLYIRKGPYKIAIASWNKTMAHESYDIILEAYYKYRFLVLVFDEIGVGYAMASEFSRRNETTGVPFIVVGLNVGSSGQDKKVDRYDRYLVDESVKIFYNLRARLYWEMRERLRKTVEGVAQNHELMFCPDERVLQEMPRMTYSKDGGKTKIVSKKELKAAKIKSPDYLDAFVYTIFAEEIAMENYIREQVYK